MSRTIDTSLSPDVIIQQVGGHLQVRGWDGPQVIISSSDDSLQVDTQEDQITISCEDNLDLRVPESACLTIHAVQGNAGLKLLQDLLTIGTVEGSLDLRSVAGVTVDTVSGNLTLKSAGDDVRIGRVEGNADLRSISGDCHLEQVTGNLEVQHVDGELHAAVEGNARVRLSSLTSGDYDVHAEGNVYCYLSEDASVSLHLSSEGEAIKVRLPDGSKTYQQAELDLTLGDGSAHLTLAAGGTVYLFIESEGWERSPEKNAGIGPDFGQQIAQQVESQIHTHMQEVTRRLNDEMERLSERLSGAGLSPEDTDRIVQQAMRSSEREASRSQEKLRRAQEKLERKLEAQRRKSEARAQASDRRTRRSWGFEWPAPPTPPMPPNMPTPPAPPRPPSAPTPVSEEERLFILRMLEQKKISLEEADRLLSALEDKE